MARAHPGVQVISRDRGGIYAQGAREGAPQAVQVADRFHLMQNLGDCLEKVAQKGIRLTEDPPTAEDLPQESPPEPVVPPTRPPTRVEQAKAATRQRRQDAILGLVQQGASIRTIARLLDMSRETVRRYLLILPDNARPPQPSICGAYRGYLQQRWEAGVHNGRNLYQEIRAQGYAGSESGLRHYLRT